MEQLVKTLSERFSHLHFREGKAFFWSPETEEVVYTTRDGDDSAIWSLLHETSHALLEHKRYGTDFELLKLEVDAWEKAKELAASLAIEIDDDHIQDCLDSYRDWIYARSICPQCGTKSLQQADLRHYRCFNCHEVWRVTPSRFCRAYRATKRAKARHIEQFDALSSI